jgi:uncharacterized protein
MNEDPALRLLEEAHTIAVVGLSTDPGKYSHAVPAYLQSIGYRIIPVHPHAVTLLGETVHRSLADVTEPVDIVAVYRPSSEAEEITAQAVAIGARAVWLQEAVVSPAAERVAAASDLAFVQGRCMGKATLLLRTGPPPEVWPPPVG